MEKHVLKTKAEKALQDISLFMQNHPFIKELKSMSKLELSETMIKLAELYTVELDKGYVEIMKLFRDLDRFLNEQDINKRQN